MAVVRFGVSDSSRPTTATQRGGQQARADNNNNSLYPNLGEDRDDERSNHHAIGSGGGDHDDRSHSNAINGLGSFRPGKDYAKASIPAYLTTMLSFTATNFYHLRDGKPARDYPWLKDVKLVEPHRETALTVTDPRQGFHYRWEFRSGGGGGSGGQVTETEEAYATAVGAECTVVLTRLDENVVSLEEVNEDGEVSRRLEERVIVKYVRREIRTLTDEEREELLDAVRPTRILLY